jgi:hypothetical protein
MGEEIMGFFTSLALFVISTVMQMQAAKAARRRQEKAAREAAERADAAKGFQIPVEGEASILPVQYGRGLLGGVRVYHNTSNNFANVAPASGSTLFQNSLDESREGVKHEFLTIQVALCFGDINSCQMVLVDGNKYTDEKYKSIIGAEEYLDAGKTMGGHRIHFNPTGGIADPLLQANHNLIRKFSNTAYATCVFALNRDEYQYNGVPDVRFIVEGLKVYSIIGEVGDRRLSAIKTYSNNPALCLLDYLTNNIYGRGLPLEYIDLDAFAYAADVCDEVVVSTAPLEGTYWTEKGGTRFVKRYECNLALTPNKSIRDNVEILLETMGQAELVWSGGKYKLSLEYPKLYTTNTLYLKDELVQYSTTTEVFLYRALAPSTSPLLIGDALAYLSDPVNWELATPELTDEDIIRSTETSVAWPSSSERFNFATVRYLNEAKDFVEDSISWPFKVNTVPGAAADRGIWNATTVYARSDIVTYNSVKYQCIGNLLYSGTWNDTIAYVTGERVLYLNNYYVAVNNPAAGILPTVTASWTLVTSPQTLLAPSNDNAWVEYNEQAVYNIYREEDHGIPLEADFFEAGTTDFYHALAKAEQRVRFSRSSTVYKFSVTTKWCNLEPGDIIKVNSTVLNIPGELIRIEEIKANARGNAEITGSKFDASSLAWNVNDFEIVTPPTIFDTEIVGQCTNLTFSSSANSNLSSGKLSWQGPADIRVQKFGVKYTTIPLSEVDLTTTWIDLGETRNTSFDLPSMPTANYTLTVIAYTATGMSPRDTGLLSKWPLLAVGLSAITFDTTKLIPLTVYTRSSILPTTPTGGVFSFSSLSLTSLPTGNTTWSALPPSGSEPLYGSTAIAETLDLSINDSSLTWSTPVSFSDEKISVLLSQNVLGVTADFSGLSTSYSTGNFIIKVNDTDYTTSNEVTYSIIAGGTSNCTPTINSTNGSPNKGLFTLTDLTDEQGYFKVRATFRNKNYDFLVTVIKLKDVYIIDTTPPPAPTGVTVTVGYSNVGIFLSSLPTYTEGHGHDTTLVYAAQGVAPIFSEAILIGEFSGTAFQLSSEANYQRKLWFKNKSIDGVISTTYFGGTNGINGSTSPLGVESLNLTVITSVHTVMLYKQVSTQPTAPTGGSYNFSTNTVVPPSGWSVAMPNSTTTPTYATEYTFSTATPTETVTATTWSTPFVFAQIGISGTSGVDGLSTFVMEIYSTGITSTPTGGTYTFSTDNLDTSSLSAGWSRAMPSSGTVGIYRSSYVFTTNTPGTAITAGTWTTPILTALNGTNGTNGTNGINGTNGASAIVAIVSNESHVLPADNTGTVSSYVGSGTLIRVYEGATELLYDGIGTANSSWTITSAVTNITRGTLTDSGAYVTIGDHSGVATAIDTSLITYTITGKSSAGTIFTITKTQTFTKAKSGANGANGTNGTSPLIYDIITSTPVITKDAIDAATSGIYSSVTIQGKSYNGSTTSNYGWLTVTANTGIEATTATDTATTAITLSPTTTAGTTSYTIKMYNQATVAGATLLDTQVINVVFKGLTGANGANGTNGAAAITAILSNETHVVPADNAGVVSSYLGTGTQLRVYEGAIELSYDGIGTANSSWAISSIATNITRGTLTDSGTYLTVGDHSGIASGIDTSTIVYTITGKSSLGVTFTITKTQNFSKAKSGANGSSGTDGNAYWTVTDVNVIKKSNLAVYTPSIINVTLYKAVGATSPVTYSGRFVIATSPDGTNYTNQYSSSIDETTKAYTIPASIIAIRIRSYLAGGTTTLLDEQIIPIISDGSNGSSGTRGAGIFYAVAASAAWSDSVATARILAITGTANVEGDTVTETFADTWSLTKIWSAGAWVASGQVIDGNLIITGSIAGTKIAALAIDTAQLKAGAVTADKITVTGGLSAISANLGSITSGNITLDSVSSIKGGQTAYNTGTGFFLGYSGTTYKFSIGNSTTGLTWDGTAFTIKGDMTAGSIALGSNFGVTSNGTVTIRSGTTGARLEMTNNVIKVYDANNILRVKLGNLA